MKIHNLGFLLLFSASLACNETVEVLASYPVADVQAKLTSNKSGVANIIFKSADGGQTWQDISEGLPEKTPAGNFFANDKGLYLRAGNGIYHSKPNSTAPFWENEISTDEHSSIAPGKTGIFAYNYYEGQFRQKINGSSVWSPIYANFRESGILNVFETAGGTVFISCDRGHGFFKSTDNGNTWKKVHTEGVVLNLVESNGVLVAISHLRTIRSTDDGETWETVISEGGTGTIEIIDGGFAAITYNTKSNTRSVRTSYDGGKTWQAIDAGLPASPRIASIIQVGEYFYCGHPNGIFRSSDKGKTWKLLLPSIDNKIFNLSVSGGVIYAMPRAVGC